MKLAIATAAGLAMAATANAQSLDIGGQTYDAADGTVALGTIVSGGSVTDIAFDLAINAGNFGESGSWGSEFTLQIDGPGGEQFIAGGGDAPADLTFGWGNSGGSFSFSGSAAFSGGAGTYTVSVFDTFDDTGNDGFIFEDSTVTLIPTPGSAAILGLGGLAAVRRRR